MMGERKEWIVEAALPGRRVKMEKGAMAPVEVVSEDAAGREARLGELYAYLEAELELKPVLLRAAGAVSISATEEELARIKGHPLVKGIGPNRRLK